MHETECSNSTSSSMAALESKGPKTPRRKMISLGLIVACSSMLLGMIQGFVIAAVPQIKGTIDDVSWFASMCGLVAPVGSLAVGVIIDKFGRRSALLWGILPSIFGWLFIYLSERTSMLLFGRALCGLTYGALMYPQQVYTAECILVNQQRLLDSFKIWTGVANGVGALFCLLTSQFLRYRELASVVMVASILEFLLVFELLPESPIWLILQGRYGDAEWAQKKLGIHTSILYDERVNISATTTNAACTASCGGTENKAFSIAAVKRDFNKIKRKDVYKPLITTVILFSLIMASGPMTIMAYMISIIGNRPVIENSTRSSVSPDAVGSSDSLQFSIISATFALLAHIILCFVLPYSSIRKISIPCMFMMAVGLAVLAYTTAVNSAHLYTFRVISVWIIVFMYNFGMFNLPAAVLGYVFPVDCKGYASITSAVYVLLGAISIKMYPYLDEMLNDKLYYGYTTFALLCGIFAFFFLPETVGKSQKEISNNFDDEN